MTAASFDYIEMLHNRKPQCTTLNYKSPIQFLDDWLIAQQKEKLAGLNTPHGRQITEGGPICFLRARPVAY